MSAIFLFAAHGAAFTLGLYAASQWKYNDPIEWYRWIITFGLFIWFGIMSDLEE